MYRQPAAFRELVKTQGQVLVTTWGKPLALLVSCEEHEDTAEVSRIISGFRAQLAIRAIRNQAQREGLAELPDEQIEGIIQKSRKNKSKPRL